MKDFDGPIITEEMWNKWRRIEEMKDADFRKILMEHNMSQGIAEMMETIAKQFDRMKTQNAIDDIIAIYHDEYKTYGDYIKTKERIYAAIKENESLKKEETFFEGKPCNLSFTTYVDPVILSQEVFDYIINNYTRKILRKEDTNE